MCLKLFSVKCSYILIHKDVKNRSSKCIRVKKWKISWQNIIRRNEIVFYTIISARKVKLFHYANFWTRSRVGISSALPRWELFSMNDDGKLLFVHAQSPPLAPLRIPRAVAIFATARSPTPPSFTFRPNPPRIWNPWKLTASRPTSAKWMHKFLVVCFRRTVRHRCCRHKRNNATCFFVLYDSPPWRLLKWANKQTRV